MQFNRYTWPIDNSYEALININWKTTNLADKFTYVAIQGIPGTVIVTYYKATDDGSYQKNGEFQIGPSGFFELTFPSTFLVNSMTINVKSTYLQNQAIVNSLMVDIITDLGSNITMSKK